jgi:hypothetical protein
MPPRHPELPAIIAMMGVWAILAGTVLYWPITRFHRWMWQTPTTRLLRWISEDPQRRMIFRAIDVVVGIALIVYALICRPGD